MVEAELDQVLSRLLHVLPEVRVIAEAGAVVEPGLVGGRDALLVELVHDDVRRGRQHHHENRVGRVRSQRDDRGREILARPVERLEMVLDVGRLLLQRFRHRLRLADAVVGVLAESDDALHAEAGEGLRHGESDARVVVGGIEDLLVALLADVVRPAVGVDVGNVVALRDLDLREAIRALVRPYDGDHLVARDELLDRGAALLRDALIVLVDQGDLLTVHPALLVDHVLHDLEAVLHLDALDDRARRRLGEGDADLDRVRGIRRDGGGHCGRGNEDRELPREALGHVLAPCMNEEGGPTYAMPPDRDQRVAQERSGTRSCQFVACS